MAGDGSAGADFLECGEGFLAVNGDAAQSGVGGDERGNVVEMLVFDVGIHAALALRGVNDIPHRNSLARDERAVVLALLAGEQGVHYLPEAVVSEIGVIRLLLN